MARSLNEIKIIGNVGKDPEVTTHGELLRASFSVATTDKYKEEETTQWHRVTVWNKWAEVVEKYVTKGKRIYVCGKYKSREYTDENGNTRDIWEISGNDIILLDGGNKTGGGEQRTQSYKPKPPVNNDNYGARDDDIPF
jgi:single-strand DNA-binding protein